MLIFDNIAFVEIPRTGTSTLRQVTGCEPPSRHMTLKDFTDNVSGDFYLCSIVRNPFDRVASLYEHTKVYHPNHWACQDFPSFCEWFVQGDERPPEDYHPFTLANIRQTQFDVLSINDRLAVDWVGRFENYKEDAGFFLRSIGFDVELPVVNKIKQRPYPEYYDADTAEKIANFVAPDLIHFKYF